MRVPRFLRLAGAALGLLALAFVARVVSGSVRATEVLLHPPRHPVALSPGQPPLPGSLDVSFVTPDGVTLRGWYVPSRNRAAVVLCHGLGENRTQMMFEAQTLVRAGYGALLFDSRGHGESGGDLVTWGDRERRDLAAALDFLSKRPDVDPERLGAIGFSLGGAMALLVAESDPRLKAVVAMGTFVSLEDELRWNFRRWGPLSALPAIWTMKHAGVQVDEVRPIDGLCRIAPRPVLFVFGSDDPYVPLAHRQRLIAAACEPKGIWQIEGAGHGGYDKVAPAAYPHRLLDFLNPVLMNRP